LNQQWKGLSCLSFEPTSGLSWVSRSSVTCLTYEQNVKGEISPPVKICISCSSVTSFSSEPLNQSFKERSLRHDQTGFHALQLPAFPLNQSRQERSLRQVQAGIFCSSITCLSYESIINGEFLNRT
jgi:hypothetical protein